MIRVRLVLLVLMAISWGCWWPGVVRAAEPGWQPRHTWVFVVGLLQFQHRDIFGSFPGKNRRDVMLVQLLKARGVPAGQITYLQDRQATLPAVQSALAALLRQTAPGDMLFLYYAGHGYRDDAGDGFFAAYDTDDDKAPGWSVNSIIATIDRSFKGSGACLAADCCDSGTMAQVVGKHQGRIGYACVASSSAHEVSTGHWTFTDCLLDALRGAPYVDLDGDGVITLAELAAHAHADMLTAEEQHSSFATSGGFAPDTILSRAGPRPKPPIGNRVKVNYEGDWYVARVVDAQQGRLKVHYIGYDDPDDWYLAKDPAQVRRVQPVRTFPSGATVEVKWKGQWYPATILKVEGGVHYIHYLHYDASWDEWVPSRRIRKAPQ